MRGEMWTLLEEPFGAEDDGRDCFRASMFQDPKSLYKTQNVELST